METIFERYINEGKFYCDADTMDYNGQGFLLPAGWKRLCCPKDPADQHCGKHTLAVRCFIRSK